MSEMLGRGKGDDEGEEGLRVGGYAMCCGTLARMSDRNSRRVVVDLRYCSSATMR